MSKDDSNKNYGESVFLRARRLLKKRFMRFGPGRSGSVSVEMAFILPIFAAMAFLTLDAGTIYTQYQRGLRNFYSIGDIIAASTTDLTCSQLDTIAESVYTSYATGNWARRVRNNPSNTFNANGAPDFRFSVKMLEVGIDPSDGELRGEIKWAYWRHNWDMDRNAEAKPGDWIDVPDGLKIDGLETLFLDGSLYVAPMVNYFGIFDLNSNENRTHKNLSIDRYFPIRFRTGLNLEYSVDDPLSEKCWSAAETYP